MEHVHEYNEAVTKLKLLLDQTSPHSNAEGPNNGGDGGGEIHRDMDVMLSRQGSLRRVSNHHYHQADQQKKKWASQEDLFHASHHTKGELRGLVNHQEEYISQLEEELSFCRNQLKHIIDEVKIRSLEQEKATQEMVKKLKAENENLKHQVETKYENLKRDNVWLVNAVQELKDETMELQRRETEAVEQVRQSIHMAEQISLEKTQLELEMNQSKQQLDRQQERMKNLIEEQLDKVEEVRVQTEQRCRNEYSAILSQSDENSGQIARLTTELEQCQKRESESKRQINERKILANQVQEDYETRIGQLHLDIVNLRSAKQQLEHELGCIRMDYDHCKSDLESLNARHKNEVESYRSRLQRTEQILDENRNEMIGIAERKSLIERELNLIKASLNGKQQHDIKMLDHPETVHQLKSIINRQKHIIDELRSQCTDLATKLEYVSKSYSDQVSKLSQQLGESLSQIQILQGQSKQYGQMYEQCCRKIQDLEDEKMAWHHSQMQVPKMYPAAHHHRHQQYQKEAIVIEQDGVITSPLSKNR